MTVSIVITFMGLDRPGIVATLSKIVAEHGGNWMESRMGSLADRFVGIVRVAAPESKADPLVHALRNSGLPDLDITVDRDEPQAAEPTDRVLSLHLLGQDRPGILREISGALVRVQGIIDELESQVIDASMAGGTLFEAKAIIRIPKLVPVGDLRAVLENLADELMVDITLDTSPSTKDEGNAR
jgi:glycine cleavage system regulatory protein